MKATEIKNIKNLPIAEASFINIMLRGYIVKTRRGDLYVYDFEPRWDKGIWEPHLSEFSCMLINSEYFQFIKQDECWYFERNGGMANVTNTLKEAGNESI